MLEVENAPSRHNSVVRTSTSLTNLTGHTLLLAIGKKWSSYINCLKLKGLNQLVMKRCLSKYLETSQDIIGDLQNEGGLVLILKFHHPMRRHCAMSYRQLKLDCRQLKMSCRIQKISYKIPKISYTHSNSRLMTCLSS